MCRARPGHQSEVMARRLSGSDSAGVGDTRRPNSLERKTFV